MSVTVCRHGVGSGHEGTLIALDAPPSSTLSTASWWLRKGHWGPILFLGWSTRYPWAHFLTWKATQLVRPYVTIISTITFLLYLLRHLGTLFQWNSASNRTEGLAHIRQALCCWATASAFFLLLFLDASSLSCPDWLCPHPVAEAGIELWILLPQFHK